MLVDQFDNLLMAKPFQPFRIFTADGWSTLVKSPEFAWHAPAGRTVFIASIEEEGRVHIVDLHLVTRFERDTLRSNGKHGRRQK
jgi:hypothetical protein